MRKPGIIVRHGLLAISFVFLCLLLNRPEVIVVSRLGYVVWYPAAGLALAFMLGISPWYALLVCISGVLAGKLFYNQPLATYGETIGAAGGAVIYGLGAYVLRQRLKIDSGLRRRRDVVLYVSVTTVASLCSTAVGVACLAADHTIRWAEYGQSASVWFLGDEIGLLGVAPFLLIHVLPWVRDRISADRTKLLANPRHAGNKPLKTFYVIEGFSQALALIVFLWAMFGPPLSRFQLFFLCFIPIIWIAMRQGIRRVVSGLLALNFGIVVALHFFPATADLLSKMGLLMFVVSALGLLVGSAVTERHRIAIELFDRTAELQEANSQLLASKQKAEDASRTKSEFLANMSHEIRTPINGILGMAELVLDTEITAEQRDYLGMLKSSADSLLRVINDILDFSKIESGKLELCPVEFNLHDTVGDAVRALSLRAHEKELELALYIAPEVPEFLVGDSGRLCQILINLVGNAIKFTPKGEIVVRTEVDSEATNGVQLHFSVADTGIGIPADKHALIFEAFSQADGSTTRNYGGTGLGLSISSHLVKLLGGRIWVESEPGKGSTFHFTIHCERSQNAVQKTSSTPSDFAGLPLLVVDDNNANRRILIEMTKAWGICATAAENGNEALEKLREAKKNSSAFRLVIVDSCMPEMTGFELVECIRRDPRLADITIMMLTSAGQRGDAARCRELGIASYLFKPIRKSELLSVISGALRQSAKRNPHAVPSNSPESSRQLRILVAEDNLVNQTVILHMLTNQGHLPTIVGNGKEAVAALQTESFDLVFMDVQMPEMDGLNATHKIRENEALTGVHVPIIAMTAHAMKGDKESCLAAGMDGYLAKPVSSKQIEDLISVMLNPQPRSQSQPLSSTAHPLSWDPLKALEKVDGDEVLLRELMQIFLEEGPRQLDTMNRAIEHGDANAMERTAHSLKGELRYLGLVGAAQQACELETLGRTGKLQLAADLFPAFRSEIFAVAAVMQQVLQSPKIVTLPD